MNALLKNLSIIILISLSNSCYKDSICDTFPCDENKLNIKDFAKNEFRKGLWISVTNKDERTPSQDTIEFLNDSIWSFWNKYRYTLSSGIFNKKYNLKSSGSNVGYIYNYANFYNQTTTTFRTYEWFYDTAKGFVYIDFNRDFRFSGQPVVYSRFIKVQ